MYLTEAGLKDRKRTFSHRGRLLNGNHSFYTLHELLEELNHLLGVVLFRSTPLYARNDDHKSQRGDS